ncbi:hypothetical protein QJS10_CPB13g01385 [Acorus calamus]|uniref:RNase H type-1 domain-containing protein n=1 Tax=Acorus calamus TaxID=4465 RepID=A0AAV9DEU9_ACOCL|nr:hypothetical protein QJS10_CPB13g01385 [Acorus calamus]
MQDGLDITISKLALQIQEIFWVPPPLGWLRANTDGSKFDDRVGYGFLLRDQFVHLIQAVAACVEAKTMNFLELQSIVQSVKAAMELGVNHLWVESDSKVAVHWITRSDKVPWRREIRVCTSPAASLSIMAFNAESKFEGATMVRPGVVLKDVRKSAA